MLRQRVIVMFVHERLEAHDSVTSDRARGRRVRLSLPQSRGDAGPRVIGASRDRARHFGGRVMAQFVKLCAEKTLILARHHKTQDIMFDRFVLREYACLCCWSLARYSGVARAPIGGR